MPTLRTWMVQHPRDWSDAERQQYAEDCTLSIAEACTVQLQHVGPMTTVEMLLAVVRAIVRDNPEIADPAMDALMDVAGHIAKDVPDDSVWRTVN